MVTNYMLCQTVVLNVTVILKMQSMQTCAWWTGKIHFT